MSLFARGYDLVMGIGERGRVGALRRAVVGPARGRVLEIGAGTGLNFPYYQPGAVVIATDPDAGMLQRARSRAREADADILLIQADAQALPFPDAAFDEAVVGLAFCTIPQPARALGELRRILRPHGRLRMLEHVRVDHPAIAGRIQDWLTPVWRRVAGGCHLNRRTAGAVASAGFAVEHTSAHWGGYLETILARAPGEPVEPGTQTW